MVINLQDSLTNPNYLLLLSFLLLVLVFLRRRLRNPTLNPPPGPPPLPLIGNIRDLGAFPHLSSHHLSQKYGPLLQFYVGRIPTVFVCDADTASEVLKSQDHIFCSRAQIVSIKRFTYGGNDLAFSPFGDHWKTVRRLCNVQVFSLRKVQSFHDFRRQEVDMLVGTIARTSARGEAVNFSEMALCYVNNVLFREVFGERASGDGECGWSPFQGLLKEVGGAMSTVGAEDLVPAMGWVDKVTGWRAKMERIFGEMDGMFEEKIRKRVKLRKEGKHEDDEDFLDALLSVRDKEDGDASLNMNIVKGILMVG